MPAPLRFAARTLIAVALAACASAPPAPDDAATPTVIPTPAPTPAAAAATPDEAKAFVAEANVDLKRLWTRQMTNDWVHQTYLTEDTDKLSAWAAEETMGYLTEAIPASAKYRDLPLDRDSARMIHLLRSRSNELPRIVAAAGVSRVSSGMPPQGGVQPGWHVSVATSQ